MVVSIDIQVNNLESTVHIYWNQKFSKWMSDGWDKISAPGVGDYKQASGKGKNYLNSNILELGTSE